jgi:radical SAM family uncharacterized protein
MISPSEIEQWLDRNLMKVQKPGRYVGGELNQVIKSWDKTFLHTALIFPDIYDIGLPNLGLAILYDEINKRENCLAERAYAPWIDLEKLIREDKIPLFSLESRHPLASFDLLGITLPYETIYTNTLNILDLSGIPLHSKDRMDSHPLVVAGGNATTNPEPMAEFIDAFALGDGEEVIHEILDVLIEGKKQVQGRVQILKKLSKVDGIYVPRFYQTKYAVDGKLQDFQPVEAEIPKKIRKRIVAKLPPPETRFLVPNINVVHNRIAIEIMRGCTRGCRFCHAGMINRPVRERSVDEIISGIDTAMSKTGFEEIALLSLSSSDYSQIQTLIEQIRARYITKHLNIALPSLRIESVSVDILDGLRGSRQGSFTLAPEAASEKLRNTINKPISSQNVVDVAREIYQRGWLAIKLYFLIGNPGETMEDIHAISQLCKQVLAEGKKVHKGRANLHVALSTFVPKPHTPFQWVAMDSLVQIQEKQQILQKELRVPGIRVNWTDPRESMLEAWLSRGDRRMAEVIFNAWKNGAKFDAWQDQFRFSIWMQAFQETGLDPEFYSHRERSTEEILPWDHIFMGVTREFLARDWEMSKAGKTRPDCREQCYACGILPYFSNLREETPGVKWQCPEGNQA